LYAHTLLQVVKVGVSLYYGSRMQCQVLPEKLGRLKVERHLAELQGQRQSSNADKGLSAESEAEGNSNQRFKDASTATEAMP